MDFLWLFWPNSVYNLLPWKVIERLRYKDSPYIPVIGENPFYPDTNYAWWMDVKTVFPHTKRHRAMRAICKNDLKELKQVLDEGYDIDAPVELQHERTALGLASFLNRPQLVEYLILRGANLDKPDGLGNTPLMDTVDRVNMECMMSLVKYGADLHKRNLFNKEPSAKAEEHNYVAIKNFIQKAADTKDSTFSLPPHTVRFRFEEFVDDEAEFTRKYYETGSQYPFNSISKAYVFNMFSEHDGPI